MIITINGKYESKIYTLDEEKLIYKMDCECKDFIYRRIKAVGEFADIKYYYTPCKHLKNYVEDLIKRGFKLKVPKEEGKQSLTMEVKNKVIKRSNNICEMNGCLNEAFYFHRLIRGSNGGNYTFENIKHLCGDCHRLIHSNEFLISKSK